MKKILSIIVVMCLFVGISSMGVSAATVRTTPLDVTAMATTATPEEGWAWNAESKVLTLSGIDFQIPVEAEEYLVALLLPKDATVVLTEGTENKITFSSATNDYSRCAGVCYGVENLYSNVDRGFGEEGVVNPDAKATAKMEGKGTLHIVNTYDSITSSSDEFIIKDAKIVISDCGNMGINGNTISIEDALISISNCGDEGIFNDKALYGLSIKNSDITITKSGTDGLDSNEIFIENSRINISDCADDGIEGEKTTIKDSKIDISKCSDDALAVDDISIKGSIVNCADVSYAINASNVSILSSTMQIKNAKIDGLTCYDVEARQSSIIMDKVGENSINNGLFDQCRVIMSNMVLGFWANERITFKDSLFNIEAIGTTDVEKYENWDMVGVGIGTTGSPNSQINFISSKGTVTGTTAAVYVERTANTVIDAYDHIGIDPKNTINIWGNQILKGGEIVEKAGLNGYNADITLGTIGTKDGTYAYHEYDADPAVPFGYPEGDYSKEVEIGLPFTDVDFDDWYYSAVAQSNGYQLFSGTSKTTFSPDATMSRGMVVTVLYRLAGEPAVTGVKTPFTDVSSDQYYANAVAWAYKNGIGKGLTDTRFAPNADVTREEFATFLYRYADYKKYDTAARADFGKYTDRNQVSSWAYDAMNWCVAHGYISGVTTTTLVPQGNALRCQAATILVRFANNPPAV